MMEELGREREMTVQCLCCKHCLPPLQRVDGNMCELEECNYEEYFYKQKR